MHLLLYTLNSSTTSSPVVDSRSFIFYKLLHEGDERVNCFWFYLNILHIIVYFSLYMFCIFIDLLIMSVCRKCSAAIPCSLQWQNSVMILDNDFYKIKRLFMIWVTRCKCSIILLLRRIRWWIILCCKFFSIIYCYYQELDFLNSII